MVTWFGPSSNFISGMINGNPGNPLCNLSLFWFLRGPKFLFLKSLLWLISLYLTQPPTPLITLGYRAFCLNSKHRSAAEGNDRVVPRTARLDRERVQPALREFDRKRPCWHRARAGKLKIIGIRESNHCWYDTTNCYPNWIEKEIMVLGNLKQKCDY